MSAEYWQELSAPIRIIDILKEGLGSTCHHWCHQKLRYIHISKETLLYSKRKLLLLPHAIKNQCRARVVKAGQSILEKLALKSQNKKDFYTSFGTIRNQGRNCHIQNLWDPLLSFSLGFGLQASSTANCGVGQNISCNTEVWRLLQYTIQ